MKQTDADHQKDQDDAADFEAFKEEVWRNDQLLLRAIRFAGQDDITIGDAIHEFTKSIRGP